MHEYNNQSEREWKKITIGKVMGKFNKCLSDSPPYIHTPNFPFELVREKKEDEKKEEKKREHSSGTLIIQQPTYSHTKYVAGKITKKGEESPCE